MMTIIIDTSYNAVSSYDYDLRNNIEMNKNTRKYCDKSNTPFSKIGNHRKKQIANIKFISNHNRETW